jgi:hypothetical protein
MSGRKIERWPACLSAARFEWLPWRGAQGQRETDDIFNIEEQRGTDREVENEGRTLFLFAFLCWLALGIHYCKLHFPLTVAALAGCQLLHLYCSLLDSHTVKQSTSNSLLGDIASLSALFQTIIADITADEFNFFPAQLQDEGHPHPAGLLPCRR